MPGPGSSRAKLLWYLCSSWMLDRDDTSQVTETTHSPSLSTWVVFLPVAQTRPRSNKALDLLQATQSSAAFIYLFFHFSLAPYFLGSAPTPQALQLSMVWHSHQTQHGTPLSITSALCSPGLRSRNRNSKPRFGTPPAATFRAVQPGHRRTPQPRSPA